jgi:transcriptional regulator with XRE-family HTH domain
MASKFGELLRRLRKEKGKSMGDLARHLVVSVPYISDVESRSQFRLDATTVSYMARQVGAALERRWSDLSEEELRNIGTILRGNGEEN